MRPWSRSRRSLRLIAPERRRDSLTDCAVVAYSRSCRSLLRKPLIMPRQRNLWVADTVESCREARLAQPANPVWTENSTHALPRPLSVGGGTRPSRRRSALSSFGVCSFRIAQEHRWCPTLVRARLSLGTGGELVL